MTAFGRYTLGINMTRGPYESIVEAVRQTEMTTPMAAIQIDMRHASPVAVDALANEMRVYVRGCYIEEIESQWPIIKPIISTRANVVFRMRHRLDVDRMRATKRWLAEHDCPHAELIVELPAGIGPDDLAECVDRLTEAEVRPGDISFCVNTASAHMAGIDLRNARHAYDYLRGMPAPWIKLIYFNGVRGSGGPPGIAIPGADDDRVWGGSPRHGAPPLPWAGPMDAQTQKKTNFDASGCGLIVRYARHHGISLVFECRATHHYDEVIDLVKMCGRA
jgi:hypothetical protein